MALTRKMLSAMGIEAEKIDEIIDAHSDTVNGLKEEIDKYKADAQRVVKLEEEIQKLQEDGDKSPYKVKYDSLTEEHEGLKKEFEDYKNEITAKETKSKKETAYKKLLKDAGVSAKRIDAVLRVTDLDKLDFEEDGFKDAESITANIKKEWSDFIPKQGTKGADVSTPPDSNGDESNGNASRAAEIAKAHYARIYGKTEENK